MKTGKERIEELKKKYGTKAIENAVRMHPHDVPDIVDWADELDEHYTKLWLDFSYGGMFARGILDERTRGLVVIGQFVAMDELEQLPTHIRSALAHKASPREVLEVILQAGVYTGYPRIVRATRVFKQVVFELGRMDEITKTQLSRDGGNAQRSLERERAGWKTPESPKREKFLQKYGWKSLSAGLRLQPTHHVQSVERLDRVDQQFAKLWLDAVYAGMYSRGILDDKTRVLCVVGELYVMGEFHQAEHHIRNVLMLGTSGREVLEVILQSTIYAGMPRFVRFVGILERALEEQGRLAELTDTQHPLPV